MKKILENFKSGTELTIWKIVGSKWSNVSRTFFRLNKTESLECYSGTLADYMFCLRMDIPDYIKYCLAENDICKVKFHHIGNIIYLYMQRLD